MRNAEVAALLEVIGRLLEIKGENRFKFQAFTDAARRLENWPEPVEKMYLSGRLREIPGVGASIARIISDYLELGSSPALAELAAIIPEELVTLTEIPGVGPKLALTLYRELGVCTVDELEAAILAGQVERLPRMGAKSAAHILEGIQVKQRRSGRILLGVARPLAESMISSLAALPEVIAIEICGSLRRWKETIGDLDLLVAAREETAASVMDSFTSLPEVRQVLLRGPTKSSVIVFQGLQVDLRVVPLSSFGAALQYFTGSQAHNIRLRELAIRQGLRLNEYGLTRLEDGTMVAGRSEEEIYGSLGLPFIPPELREDQGEIQAAQDGTLPLLVELSDIRGDLHVHTDWSDGQDTLEQMATQALASGYDYLAICDHAQALGVAGGLSEERFAAQREVIGKLSSKLPVAVLAGIEANILQEGHLDFPPGRLSAFDWVVAGLHSGLRDGQEQINRRMQNALRTGAVDCISHPTGRLLGERESYALDLHAFLAASRENGVALEINALPKRLDLRDVDARLASEHYGLQIAINTDAHSAQGLSSMRYGVATARRAWLRKEDVLNAKSIAELREWIAARR